MARLLAVLLTVFLISAQPASPEPPFETISLNETAWVTSGAWLRGRLIVLDVSKNRLAWVREGKLKPLDPLLSVPTKAQALNAGDLLISSAEKEYYWETVRPTEDGYTIQGSWSCESCGVADWESVTEKLVFAVGDVRTDSPADSEESEPSSSWTTGFYWISPAGPELAHRLAESEYPLYLHGLPLLAVANGNAYAVATAPAPAGSEATRPRRLVILELPRNQRSSRVLAKLPHPAPELSFREDVSFSETFRAVSALEGPIALLSWEDRLYLALKSRRGLEIWHVDTNDGGLHFKEILPGSDFVTLVPGPEAWAVLLKGPVTGFGQQRVQSVVHVPSERLR